MSRRLGKVELDYDDVATYLYEDSAFFAAVREADRWRDATWPKGPKKTGDMSRLIELLRWKRRNARPDVLLTREERELLRDLVSRGIALNRNRGGRKRPLYKQTSWTKLALNYYTAFFAAVSRADTWRDPTANPKFANRDGDLSQLADVLRRRLAAGTPERRLTCAECELLIDLLSRHKLKQKPGAARYRPTCWTRGQNKY